MRAIHLCIDMQEGERIRNEVPAASWHKLKNIITRFSAQLADESVPTLHVAFINDDIPLACGTVKTVHDFMVEQNSINIHAPKIRVDFGLRPSSLIGIKNTFSAYESRPIRRYLEDNHYDTVILSGVWEDRMGEFDKQCVSLTARDFAHASWNTIIAGEATNLGIFDYRDNCSAQGMESRTSLYKSPNLRVMPLGRIISMVAMPKLLVPAPEMRGLVTAAPLTP